MRLTVLVLGRDSPDRAQQTVAARHRAHRRRVAFAPWRGPCVPPAVARQIAAGGGRWPGARAWLRPIDRLAQGEDRRRAILEVAAALFAELGYRDTSTKLIAQRAGISEPLVFHHFGSKLGLLRALASTSGMTPVHVAEALAAAKDPPLATLPQQLVGVDRPGGHEADVQVHLQSEGRPAGFLCDNTHRFPTRALLVRRAARALSWPARWARPRRRRAAV
jgi:AcrR family transcriptional regulator